MSCIVLVGGGIGCGKTTLINFMLKNKKDLFGEINTSDTRKQTERDEKDTTDVCCSVIQFDNLCSIEEQEQLMKSLRGLRNFRADLLMATERLITFSCNCENSLAGPLTQRSYNLLTKLNSINSFPNVYPLKIIFIVEDNFYYRSMRYDWFQVAKRTNLGFASIFLHCPLNVAINRNSTRGYQIPEDRIKKMLSFVEFPDPIKYKWEKMSVIHDSSSDLTNLALSDIIKTIKEALKNPVEFVISEEKIEAQKICSKNVVHQSDKILRKLVSKIISNLKAADHINEDDDDDDDDNFKTFVSQLVNIRQQLLSDIKQGIIDLPDDLVEKIQNLGIESVLSAYEERLQQLFIMTLEENSLYLSSHLNNLHIDDEIHH